MKKAILIAFLISLALIALAIHKRPIATVQRQMVAIPVTIKGMNVTTLKNQTVRIYPHGMVKIGGEK